MFLGNKITAEPSNSVSTQQLSANSGGEHCNLAQKWRKTPKLENNNKHLGASAILIPTNPAQSFSRHFSSLRKLNHSSTAQHHCCLVRLAHCRALPQIVHYTVIVQFVIEKITFCHLSFSCWHLVVRSFST